VVIGPPGSGKTHVGQTLAESSGLPLYSTDRFMSDLHLTAMYALMELTGDRGWIVEGMIGYRLLRKRQQFGMPPPDIVIQLDATEKQISKSYWARGQLCDVQRIKRFCRAHEAMLHDYFTLDADLPKIWIHSRSPHICHLIGGGPDNAARKDSSS
jgi:adenylate kinase family enzyme